MKKLLHAVVVASLAVTLTGGAANASGMQEQRAVRVSTEMRASGQDVRVDTRQARAGVLSLWGADSRSSRALASASRAPDRGRWRGPCSDWRYGERLTPSRWNEDPVRGQRMMSRLIRCVFDQFAPGQSSTAMYIASRESGLYPWAQNTSSLCSGLFQHILSAWPSRAASYLPRSQWASWVVWPDSLHETRLVFDPRANAMAAAKMVAGGGWGPWGG